MDINKKWNIINKETVFKSKIFKINKFNCFLPSKNIYNDFYSIDLPDWANVFALTEDNKVILVKQHRLGNNQVTLEVPAGAIDKGEDPLEAAGRELIEETGYAAEKIILIKKISVNPAIQDNICYCYLALNCNKVIKNDLDHAEEIDVVVKDAEEVFNLINTDSVDNSLSYLSIILSRDYLIKNNLLK